MEPQGPQGLPEPQALRVLPDLKDRRGLMALRVQQERQAQQAQQALREPQERRVKASPPVGHRIKCWSR